MRLFRGNAVYLLGAAALLAPVLTSVSPTLAEESKTIGYYVDAGSHEAPLRLWAEESGQGDPVLMIHGLGATTYSWRYLIPDLARNHRVIAVDLKGAGKSDKPIDGEYGILDQAAVLKTVVDRKGPLQSDARRPFHGRGRGTRTCARSQSR